MDVFLSICSPWKVGIDAFGIPFPGSWFDRVVVVHFNLDYSYPNMKNSDTQCPLETQGKIAFFEPTMCFKNFVTFKSILNSVK